MNQRTDNINEDGRPHPTAAGRGVRPNPELYRGKIRSSRPRSSAVIIVSNDIPGRAQARGNSGNRQLAAGRGQPPTPRQVALASRRFDPPPRAPCKFSKIAVTCKAYNTTPFTDSGRYLENDGEDSAYAAQEAEEDDYYDEHGAPTIAYFGEPNAGKSAGDEMLSHAAPTDFLPRCLF
jgi:hypothetical protein